MHACILTYTYMYFEIIFNYLPLQVMGLPNQFPFWPHVREKSPDVLL